MSVNEYALVVLDALYRFLPEGGEENSNETMVEVYNAVDELAMGLNSGVTLIHHSTKGSQAARSVTDVGSGGGAQSRAADAHLILREHEEPNVAVLDALVRSFPPVNPMALRWQDMQWVPAPDIDPTKLKGVRRRSSKSDKGNGKGAPSPTREWTPREFAEKFLGDTPSCRDAIIAQATQEVGKSKAESLLRRAEDEKCVVRVIDQDTGRHQFVLAQSRPNVERLGGGRRCDLPSPPVLSAQGGCGGETHTPLPPSKRPSAKPRGDTRATTSRGGT